MITAQGLFALFDSLVVMFCTEKSSKFVLELSKVSNVAIWLKASRHAGFQGFQSCKFGTLENAPFWNFSKR